MLGGEVGPSEEGPSVRREEHRQGPAPVAGHRLDHRLVDLVEVRPLLAVHLHADEVLVHPTGDGLVLEGLPLHHVAPVAGGVADGEQDGPVEAAGLGQGLLAPGPPPHRVVGVLEQVGARLVDQAVRLSGFHQSFRAFNGALGGRGRGSRAL